MYAPHPFKITDPNEITSFVEHNAFAMITSHDGTYPMMSYTPLLLDKNDGRAILTGHLSRANKHIEALQQDSNVLVVFSGPNAYVSSYAKDPENLSILPTWDYQFVQATGKLDFLDESGLIKFMEKLVAKHEAGQPKAIDLSRYPQKTYQRKLKGIIGFSIEVEEWQACFRLNQNRTVEEREHIMKHLQHNEKLVEAIRKFNP
jgi:Transcriptional regulator